MKTILNLKHSKFINELKSTEPSKWYSMAKRIGAVDQTPHDQLQVQSLSSLDDQQAAEEVADHFSSVSCEYSPLDYSKLPCYLPAPLPPQVNKYEVCEKLSKLNKTKSTLPIDIPSKLRQEVYPFLSEPLSNIINNCLSQQIYPQLWKNEWVTPVPKVPEPKNIKDRRKISGTSDYNKVMESFLKDWILEDIHENLDISQYGGKKGVGTEHMLVCLVDRIKK